MSIGVKKPASNRIGLKKMAHTINRIGLKASNVAMMAAPVALLAGPEGVAAASALEAGGAAGKAIFGLSRSLE